MTDNQRRRAGARGQRQGKKDEHGIPVGDHRCTPPEIFEAALRAIGRTEFDLDAATNEHSRVPAKVKFMGPHAKDKEHRVDALAADWSIPAHGLGIPDVWLNFPWSDPSTWVAKVLRERDRVRSLTVLASADLSTPWHRRLTKQCDAWCGWPVRAHFPLPNHRQGSPPGPVQLWYFGAQVRRWRMVMEREGCLTFGSHIGPALRAGA